MFKAYDVIAGPLKMVYVEGKKWKFHGYPNIFRYFKEDKEDRKLIFERRYSCSSK